MAPKNDWRDEYLGCCMGAGLSWSMHRDGIVLVCIWGMDCLGLCSGMGFPSFMYEGGVILTTVWGDDQFDYFMGPWLSS